MMDEDLEKMAKNLKTFSNQMVQNPYWGIPTFFGVPCQENIRDLDIALVGVPFDLGVTNRGGARMGPREIRNQSRTVGAYNHHSRMTPCAANRIADVGDVPFRTVYHLEDALQDIEVFYRNLSSAGIIPVTAGGDHSITFPILKSIAGKEKAGLVHFDSHCDTAPPIHGSGLAHGSPMRNAVESGLVDPKRSIQIGIRGSSEFLWQFSYDNNMRVVHIEEFYELGWKNVVREIRTLMGNGPVYISFDIDCLDPAFAPGTGTPVAGGMTTFEALQTLRGLKGLNIIGGDLVEVSPPYDPTGITALAGATIMFEILCLVAESPGLGRSC
ncbi:MAG: agmatinase [Methanomicrobiales archaeon]|nr:agmatinase [Methanomicrobiales archaeon]